MPPQTKTIRLFAGLLACAVSALAQSKNFPRFETYPVRAHFTGQPAAPQLPQPRARLYRSAIRDAVSAGPNFAGHYTLARWSCGPNCVSFALVEARTGRLYLPSTLKRVYVVADQDEDVLQFRLDSRLLIVAGTRNGRGSGRYYYHWDGQRLKLLRATACKFELEADPKARCPL
ncbi:MAG: hypothetical protein HYR56_08470 [Acidobacteria bacterium]|nr:hypothetical protein [Acidobacteriota bacterium]MBI3425561.1 hypothetical protein [Acidobacteriota bacterium]